MRQSEKMRMALALAGLLFCLSSAVQTLSRTTEHRGKRTVTPVSPTVANVASAEDGPSQVFARRLQDDGMIRLIPRDPAARERLLVKSGDGAYGRIIHDLQTTDYAPPTTSGYAGQVRFYRRNGSLHWTLQVQRDGTLYDPLSRAYYRIASDATRWFHLR